MSIGQRTVEQLQTMAKRNPGGLLCANAVMEHRQKTWPKKCSLPKKKQRELGLLPPVPHEFTQAEHDAATEARKLQEELLGKHHPHPGED